MELNIDLGLKSYDIRLPDGTVTGTVRFNPADPGIAARWKKVQPEVNSLTEKAHNAEEDTILDVLQEADERIKSCIDYAFGAKVGEGSPASVCVVMVPPSWSMFWTLLAP